MKRSSEAVCVCAAATGPMIPIMARAMPAMSTRIVPAKFCQMMRRVRRATRHRVDEAGKVVADQHDVGALPRDVGARAHRDADARGGESRSVVDAVAHHGDRPAAVHERANALELRLRAGDWPRPRRSEPRRRPGERRRVVAGQEQGADVHAMQAAIASRASARTGRRSRSVRAAACRARRARCDDPSSAEAAAASERGDPFLLQPSLRCRQRSPRRRPWRAMPRPGV